MYERFFGLKELPFNLTPDPRYLLLTEQHREALSILRYALATRKGLTVLTGEAGTGKTTLIRTALDGLRGGNTRCTTLTNPALRRDEFLQLFGQALDLGPEVTASKATFLTHAERLLHQRAADGITTVLIIDEAQSLSYELLEEVRLLANMETNTTKLLSVVLAGQPELGARLNDPELRQLKQRIVLRAQLTPLTIQETASYIAARIRVAGGESARLFTREAVRLIHERSNGVPRTISVICENALVTAFAADRQPVTREIVNEVCRDFDLLGRPNEPRRATVPDNLAVASPAVAPTVETVEQGPEKPAIAVEPPRRYFAFF